jgi:hypothetical protein
MAYHSPPAVWLRCLGALPLSRGPLLGLLRGSRSDPGLALIG